MLALFTDSDVWPWTIACLIIGLAMIALAGAALYTLALDWRQARLQSIPTPPPSEESNVTTRKLRRLKPCQRHRSDPAWYDLGGES